ncbi:hypothetical protein [Desulfatibacillum aliphaticivorans]|uniref:hypothetical protein n=1 Tax=Desulfatibacillum aliphaticivorans TaxID=218208 RepID=UPI000404F933|nr:hypothetical protein [Desulfatibacillum aliphaticivorans]
MSKNRLILLAALFLGFMACTIPQPNHGGLSTNDRELPGHEYWNNHLQRDLIPFWASSEATAEKGIFPTFRFDDGVQVSVTNQEEYERIAIRNGASWIVDLMGHEYIRTHARQTFAYGVAFHATGNFEYLSLMREGVYWSIKNSFDEKGALTSTDDLLKRTAQDQAYSLIGLAFYYYLTRDQSVLDAILKQHQIILRDYGVFDDEGSLIGIKWLQNDTQMTELVAILDQLNAYMVLLTPILPEPYSSEWKITIGHLCHTMLDNFYVNELSVRGKNHEVQSFWGNLNDKVPGGRHFDFGHSVKTWWMIYLSGIIVGDQELIGLGRSGMEFLIEKAYLPGPVFSEASQERYGKPFLQELNNQSSWGEKFLFPEKDQWWSKDGISIGQQWWIHCELDQAAATCALENKKHVHNLIKTSHFFVDHYVDNTCGGVWHSLNPATLKPEGMKVHAWKNAYHSFEHALILSIVSQFLKGESITLYYAIPSEKLDDSILQPYYFQGAATDIRYGTLNMQGEIMESVKFSHPEHF